jgi:hypothetical protein
LDRLHLVRPSHAIFLGDMAFFHFRMLAALFVGTALTFAQTNEQAPPEPHPPAASLEPEEIRGFERYPEAVKGLLRSALSLSSQKLGYVYGSADPGRGGMDCSGAIYYLLRQGGISDVPRSSNEQYVWVRRAGLFRAVLGTELDSFELDELAPGDLLFWAGTYEIRREPPVTHTMVYLGRAASDGLPLMFGSSDGRTYRGKKQWGVGVFEFRIPKPTRENPSRFVGYAKIPGFP